MNSGMWVASASTWTVAFSVTTSVSGAASPTRWTGTSTVTFSPRRTATKSMCSRTRRIGSTWTCLVSASWLVALDVELEQRVRAAVLERHHRVVARAGSGGSGRCRGRRRRRGSCSSRRIRRAAPLPNSVRVSAVIFSAAMLSAAPRDVRRLVQVSGCPGPEPRRCNAARPGTAQREDQPALSITEHPDAGAPSPRQPQNPSQRQAVERESGLRSAPWPTDPSPSPRPYAGPPSSRLSRTTSTLDRSRTTPRSPRARRSRFTCSEPGATTFLELADASVRPRP